MKEVIEFLELNGFKETDPDFSDNECESISYSNDKCTVTIATWKTHGYTSSYIITDADGGKSYSDDLNIYWLIGYLTYYGYIDRNYKLLI